MNTRSRGLVSCHLGHEVIEDLGCWGGVCAREASASWQGGPQKMRRAGIMRLHGRRLVLAEGGIGGLSALMHSDFRPEGHVKDSGLESSKRFLPGHGSFSTPQVGRIKVLSR